MITWYSFKHKKPPVGVEVIAYHHKWIDEDYNPTGQRVGFLSDMNGFTSAYWWDYQGFYISVFDGFNDGTFDSNSDTVKYTEPEYWTEMPKFSDATCGG